MNEIFNINRFAAFLKQNMVFSKMTYAYMLAAVAGSFLVGICMYAYFGISIAQLIMGAITITILFGPLFFEKTITRYNGVFDFTFPVSTLEKILSLIVKYVILIPVLLMGSLFLIVSLGKVIPIEDLQDFAYSFSFNLRDNRELHMLLVTQAIFVVGYFSFKRHAFIKTGLFLMALMFGLSTLFMVIIYLIAKFTNIPDVINNLSFQHIGADSLIFPILDYTVLFILPVGLWVVSYFKLREKEI
ncbi:MAG: hypothetical protein LUG51_12100 [Tannerellaceae bacterium]|nr:hypothetical protein [Tannerellaceae bacterium]